MGLWPSSGASPSEVKVELDTAGIIPQMMEPKILTATDLLAVELDRSFADAVDALDEPDWQAEEGTEEE